MFRSLVERGWGRGGRRGGGRLERVGAAVVSAEAAVVEEGAVCVRLVVTGRRGVAGRVAGVVVVA